MSTQTSALTPAQAPGINAAEWLQTPLGAYLLAQEQAYIDKTVADIFGYVALQYGLPESHAVSMHGGMRRGSLVARRLS